MENPRAPRFNRQPGSRVLKITSRDFQIVQSVYKHRFLASPQIVTLIGGSKQQILRRLHGLYHLGYLDRPRAQIDYYRRGSRPIVYAVGNKGIALLEKVTGEVSHKHDWTARNRAVTRYFMEHVLAVANAMIALECSCRNNGVEMVSHGDKILKWSVPVRYRDTTLKVGIIPDSVFGLRSKSKRDEIEWFFLEADRATMPVKRRTLKQTSFTRKLIAYQETWRRGVLAKKFRRFRVLTVTTSHERIDHLLDAHHEFSQSKGSGLFLFTHKKEFHPEIDVLKLALRNGRGDVATLSE